MAIYIAPAALGLGDLVVALPVVQQLIATAAEPVFLVVRLEEHQTLAARVPGLSGHCLEWELGERLKREDRFIDLRDHPLEKKAWWGSKPWLDAYPDWKINDILRTICSDKGLQIDFDAPYTQLTFNRRNELSGKAVFIPGSAVDAKSWPTENWLRLRDNIGDVVVLGQPDQSQEVAKLLDAGLTWYETSTIADALDAVSSCSAVVSVDTGIMHLAVHQGTPTVGLFRWSPVYVRERPNFFACVATKPCEQICYEREISASHHGKPEAGKAFSPNNWSCLASTGSSCMATISVESVPAALAGKISS